MWGAAVGKINSHLPRMEDPTVANPIANAELDHLNNWLEARSRASKCIRDPQATIRAVIPFAAASKPPLDAAERQNAEWFVIEFASSGRGDHTSVA